MSLDATLSALSGSLDETEAALKLLLARPLEDTLSDLPGPIERAKVLFWVSYAIHSCSWGPCSPCNFWQRSHHTAAESTRG